MDGRSSVMVMKKEGFNQEAKEVLKSIHQVLNIQSVTRVEVINVYHIKSKDKGLLKVCTEKIFSEPMVDDILTDLEARQYDFILGVQPLPGQFDQRAHSARECIEILTLKKSPEVKTGKFFGIYGALTEKDKAAIEKFMINPVATCKMSLGGEDVFLESPSQANEDKQVFCETFLQLEGEALKALYNRQQLAMSYEDFLMVQDYFKKEKRPATLTEIKVLDTYWSDHCRHTTFHTEIKDIEVEEHLNNQPVKASLESYYAAREAIYGPVKKPLCLMDLATINVKMAQKQGHLQDLDLSDEINACSLNVEVEIKDKGKVPYLLMFKNETHNHPTEIEPFGGAATCLGGAIRDPLSGRSYVYQGMRVTGAADPRHAIEATLEGKLPQRVITTKAAKGFSSYGNQIGLATGLVKEHYHPGFIAKRMEVGAVIGAAPKENVQRRSPKKGDLILLVGGATGRDGVGGATGSSKAHDMESLHTCGAEVQKGNPPEERKLQRFFRKPQVAKAIKRCNDFGAGGVSVAIGELSDSITIDLDQVTTKYEGLTGHELAISESQERMAIVIDPLDLPQLLQGAKQENLQATVVAKVEDHGRLIMKWQGKEIFNIRRDFIDTNGASRSCSAAIKAPKGPIFKTPIKENFKTQLLDQVKDLNGCSQKGLVEQFDATIGAGTVLMPYGGRYQLTPSQSMVAKVPVLKGHSQTVSVMSYGYQPYAGDQSPYHGGYFAVLEAISKMIASGVGLKSIRFSFQEYFRKLGQSKAYWGQPLSALLGGYEVLKAFDTAAIGGKDSMSGSFEDYHVPATLIAFSVATMPIQQVLSPELKSQDSDLYYLKPQILEGQVLDLERLKSDYASFYNAHLKGLVQSAYAVDEKGPLYAAAMMGLGNQIGFEVEGAYDLKDLSHQGIGGLIIEVKRQDQEAFLDNFKDSDQLLSFGKTKAQGQIVYKNESLSLKTLTREWTKPLEDIFPTQKSIHFEKADEMAALMERASLKKDSEAPVALLPKTKEVQVFLPVFPGTNCEYDTVRAFEKEGASVKVQVFNNQSPAAIRKSLEEMADHIKKSQIIMLAGGFSAGDEPEGSGKFIATVFRNPNVQAATEAFLEKGGLMLGICNGFQALIKLGLLPYGRFMEMEAQMPTLTFNHNHRHISTIAPVKIINNRSVWLKNHAIGEIHMTPFSHGEGRFYCPMEVLEKLTLSGQIATQYSTIEGKVDLLGPSNINGSVGCIEGITSPNGQILGKMGHIERIEEGLYKNIIKKELVSIIKSGVEHFTNGLTSA